MKPGEIIAAVRTVTNVAEYFQELQQSVRALADTISPSQRGYFTPHEEQQTQALLVSYWQARGALLELITSFRVDRQLSDDDGPAAFLTAFAATLVLVDAARFLRETAHDRAVIRRKLNEPASEFGVPARVYDTVQRSLISTRHAWHLYHAIQYYHHHEGELRSLAAGGPLASVIEIIDRLRHRLDVTLAQFARTKLRARTSGVFRRVVRDTLVAALYGLQKAGCSMVADVYVRRGHCPQLPHSVMADLRQMLTPADVLVVRKEYALTNYFLPGYWPHAALYLGLADELQELGLDQFEHVRPRWAQLLECEPSAEPRRVLESMKDGVRIRSLASPFASDSIIVLRPQLSRGEKVEALSRALAHEGKCYDFDFDFRRSDRLVCTEVVYRAFDGVGSIQFDLPSRAGRPTLAGRDLLRMALQRNHFEPVAVFAPDCKDSVVTGRDVADVLRAKERE